MAKAKKISQRITRVVGSSTKLAYLYFVRVLQGAYRWLERRVHVIRMHRRVKKMDLSLRKTDPRELDAQIVAIQKSTRTLFRSMVPVHEYFRTHFGWYYAWHLKPYYKKVHWASLGTYIVLIIGLLIYTLMPTQRLRAANFSKTWTTTADFDSGTLSNIDTSSNQAKLATTTTGFTEDFTGTTYKDAVNTTANWDTAANKVVLPGDPTNGTMTDLEDKWRMAVGNNETINVTAYDSINHFIYLGGSSSSFVVYNPATQTMTNLTSKISGDWGTGTSGNITAMTFDSTNGIIYIGGQYSSRFGAFAGGVNPANGTWTYLASVISADWGGQRFSAMGFDSTNGVVYLGGYTGRFGAFAGGSNPSAGTWTYLNSKITADWGGNGISAIAYDSINHFIYIGGPGIFGALSAASDPSTGTWSYLTTVGTFSTDWSTNGIQGMAFDSTNSIVYLAGAAGKFGAFNGGATPSSGAWYHLTSKISGSWSSSTINGIVYDSTNQFMYLGGVSAKFGAYAVNATPSSGTFTYLNSKISTDYGTSNIETIAYDSTNSIVYLSGASGKFGSFNGGGTPSSGTWTSLISKLSLSNGYAINASAYDPVNGYLYLGGENGKFAAYQVSGSTMTDLTSKISTDWSTNAVNAMTFDSANNFIYLGGANAKFGAFIGGSNPANGSWTYLNSKITTDWSTNAVNAMTFDSASSFVYIGSSAGRFGAFAVNAVPANGTWTYLYSKISTDWSTYSINAMTFDSANNIVYLGGSSAKFGAFAGGSDPANGTWTYLNSKISGVWTSYPVNSLAFDSTNSFIYVGGGSSGVAGRFGALTASATPSSSTFTSLNATIATDWSTNIVNTLVFAGGKIYLGGQNGRFGVFDGGSNPSGGTWNYLNSKLSSFWASDLDVKTLFYIPSNAIIYLGGEAGEYSGYQVGYTSNKDGISLAIDGTTQPVLKATLTATETKPTNTAITYYLSNDGGSTWNAVTSGSEYTFAASGSDLRWKANLTTTDLTATPEITNIAISYNYYTANSGTMNLQYDATQSVAWTSMSWTYTTPTNTSLNFKIKQASTQGGLAAATWSQTKAANTTPVNLTTITIGEQTGLLDSQWVEIEVDYSTSDGLNTPTLSDLTINYVINSAPEIQSVSASQSTDGTRIVNISYQVRDTDTNLNPYNEGQVEVALQYSVNSGSSWASVSTATGTGLVSVDTTSFTTKTIAWNIGTDLANSYYNNTVEIKVLLDDNELAHNTAELASSTFSIDTINPVPGAIGSETGIRVNDGTSWTNDTTPNLTLLASDNSSLTMAVSNANSFSADSFESYATTKTGWALSSGDGSKTVYVRFKDAFGNTTDASTVVLLDTTPPDMPVNVNIYDTSERSLERYSLTIIWDSVPAVADFNNYVIERSVNGGSFSQLAASSQTVYTDQGLGDSTTYSYRIKTTDTHENSSSASGEVSKQPSSGDTTPPTISGGSPSVTTSDTATKITWTTDEPSDSYVEFGTTVSYGYIQGSETLVTSHSVTVIGLSPQTQYHYRVKSKDSTGNLATSQDYTFTTASQATISAVKVSDVTLSTAIISWRTNVVTSSVINYGETESYGSQVADQSAGSTTIHTVRLSDLKSGSTYNFRVSGQSQGGMIISSDNYSFSTLAMPKISDIKVKDISSDRATITWTTDDETDSYVDFGKGEIEQSQGSSELTKQHSVGLVGLSPASKYSYRVKSRDKYNNSTTSEGLTFSTIVDTIAPKISDLKSETSIITTSEGSVKVQAIISWSTNEPSTGQVKYYAGVSKGSYQNSSLEDQSYSTSHIVIIRDLQPSTTYHIQAISKDTSANIGVSEDYTILTTKKEKSMLQLIVGVFEDTFFWVKKIKIF